MSNRERINANNASIQACIDKAIALPDAVVEVEGKTEVEGIFEITENNEYTFTPNDGEVFSSVKVTVDVPSSGGGSDNHAWRLDYPDVSIDNSWEIPFTTLGDVYGGSEFVRLETSLGDLKYVAADGTPYTYYSSNWCNVWGPPDYNIIAFKTTLPDGLVDWLNRSGKQIV